MERVRLVESLNPAEKKKLNEQELEVTLKGADDSDFTMKFNFLPIEDSFIRLFAR